MSLRYRVLPSLLNGVSQQPPMLRAADQSEAELNTWSSLADGLTKRPPTEFVAKILSTVSSTAFIHYINRDVTERYCVVIDNGLLRVFNTATGAEHPVDCPTGAMDYLVGAGPFRAVTVADYTFIVNTAKACTLAPAGSDTVAPSVDQAWLNRNTAGSTSTNPPWLPRSTQVAQYTPNIDASGYAGELPSMEKLPETAANGTLYKITGSRENSFVSYYVIRDGAVWNETVAPDQVNLIEALSMPHALISRANGTFSFAPFSWAPRRVGDKDTNPVPTFIGRTISDVFFYQNRLGLLVDENVVFSCMGDFGNFWRNTVLDYVASDVIDAAVATTNVATLKFALPFNDGIMAFADQVQFSVENGEEGLSPESLSISPVTRYEMNTSVRPVASGNEVYFCGDQNGATAVWEYTRIEQGDSMIAAEVTAHVPGYLPAGLKQLIAAPNSKAIFALTGGKDVFVYQYYWNGNEKVLSAWRKWTFDAPIIAGEYIDGFLYLVTARTDGVFLARLNLEVNAKPAEQNLQVHLDMRENLPGTFDPVMGRTTFVLASDVDRGSYQIVRSKTHPTAPGSLVAPSTYDWTSDKTFRVPENLANATGGVSYDQRYTFSRQFPQDYQGRPVVTGRLQLRTFTVAYSGTAFFRTEVAPYGAAMVPEIEEIVPAKLADFSGKVIGHDTLRLNAPVFHTGSYSFQVYGDSTSAIVSLTNDTPYSATFISAEWEGFYFNRAGQ